MHRAPCYESHTDYRQTWEELILLKCLSHECSITFVYFGLQFISKCLLVLSAELAPFKFTICCKSYSLKIFFITNLLKDNWQLNFTL